MRRVLGLVLTMTILFATIPTAHAANSFVSVVRSDVCAKTQCVKIADLIQYDNSTQKVSGKFVLDKKTGDYIRTPGMKNAHNYYTMYSGKTFVFVEPDQTTLSRSKVLTIEKSLPEYITKDYEKKTEVDFHTDKRIIQYGMWFDERCQKGITGVSTISQAINHMKNGCKGEIENSKEIITKKAPRDYCGQECQHQKWLKEAKLKSKQYLINK